MEDLAWLLDPGPQGVVISADLSNNSCQYVSGQCTNAVLQINCNTHPALFFSNPMGFLSVRKLDRQLAAPLF